MIFNKAECKVLLLFKATLDGVSGKLGLQEVSLIMAGGLDDMIFRYPFQPGLFSESIQFKIIGDFFREFHIEI